MKIKISKSQWRKIGQNAGWMPTDVSELVDTDVDAIYSPEDEENVLLGPEEVNDNHAYESGKRDGQDPQKQMTLDNPYRTDTDSGRKKYDEWMRGFKDARGMK